MLLEKYRFYEVTFMKSAARKAVRDSLASGYQHHSYEIERQIQNYVLYGKGDSNLASILTIDTYADLSHPTDCGQ